MTFEERKRAIIANGIVPGALIKCAVDRTSIQRVRPVEEWGLWQDGSVWVATEGGLTYGYDARIGSYAEVITPAPAEPSEVDRLRARVKELEVDIERMRLELRPSECQHEQTTSGGLGRASYCRDCGIEL